MMESMLETIHSRLKELKTQGLYKNERIMASAQGAEIELSDGSRVLNFCSNKYLGLANHPDVIRAAQQAMKIWG